MEKIDLKTNLEQNSKNYNNFIEDNDINIISEKDSKIFYYIYKIVNKLTDDKELLDIINSYKSLNDKDILDFLSSYYETMPNKNDFNEYFLSIGCDISISIKFLRTFVKEDVYEDGKIIYKIVINKTNDIRVPFSNYEALFSNELNRDKEFELIKGKLKKYSQIRFI